MAHAGVPLVAFVLGLSACGPSRAPILLYSGEGASRGDVAALEALLRANGLAYVTAGARDLSEERLHDSRLLIVPGGNFEQIGNALGPERSAAIRAAVQHGLDYLGICAGAFYAGDSPYHGLNLTGVRFPFYAAEARGIRKAAVPITDAEGRTLEQYWEDGPQLTGWGDVVAKYPDGTPAIVEGAVGSGWVVLSGVHPEAPQAWRRGMSFATPAETDHEYALKLVRAAMARTPLPHF